MTKPPLRIAIVAENLFGGTGVHTAALADYLAGQGDVVSIISIAPLDDQGGAARILPADSRVNVIALTGTEEGGSPRLRAAWTAVGQHPDVVYLPKGGPFDGSIPMSLLLATAAPVVIFEHDAPPFEWLLVPPISWKGPIPRLGLYRRLPRLRAAIRKRLAKKVVTNSASTRANQLRYYGQLVDEVVPLGIDVGHFTPGQNSPPATHGTLRIGLIGRAEVQMKGLDLAFAAVAQVARSGATLEVVFPVAVSEQARIAALATEAGADEQFRMIDPVPAEELPALYRSFDALLVASRFEGGPYTMLEAMACGTPVIATPVGLVPEVIEDGVNGIRVAATDSVPALVAGIERFLGLSAAARQAMGARAREIIVRHHDAERHFARLREILHEVSRR